MLNIGKLGASAAEYYLEQVARGVEDYYVHAGEAVGVWMGAGAASLGVAGEVADQHLVDLLAGKHPITGEVHAHERPGHDRVPGFDLTFRAPKSVSLLFALGAGEVSREVKVGHEMAVRAAVGYLERQAGFTRRRLGGAIVSVPSEGFIAAAFQHRTSRAGDPLLHHHVLVANLVRDVSGRWGALDGRLVYAHAKTAGYLYQAEVRVQLTQRLGVRWTTVTRGTAEIGGFPREVLRAFSRRRSEVLARMGKRGEFSAKAAQAATLDTRRRKDYAVTPEGLLPEWRRRAAAVGLTREHLAAMLDGPTGYIDVSPDAVMEALRALLAPTGLTAHASSFNRRDAVRVICELLPVASAATVERVADILLGLDDVVALGDVGQGSAVQTRPEEVPDQRRFTTRELLTVEHDLVELAAQRNARASQLLQEAEARGFSLRLNPAYAGGAAPVPPGRIAAALRARPSLSDEQRAMIERLAGGRDAVVVVRGHAGTGKTVALDACREAWERSGYRVVGCALSAQAAAELQAGSGITATTVDRLLLEIASGRGSVLPPDTSVLVVDEAGMVGTRLLARLLDRARWVDAKVVLVGDDRQLPEIDAGGAFRGLCDRLGAVELTANLRQRAEWERQALQFLRDGQAGEALRAYLEHGRVVVGPTADAVRSTLVADWWAAEQTDPGGAVMVALRRVDVRELNERARAYRIATGAVYGPEIDLPTGAFAAGDRVVTTRNARHLGVLNGSRGTIVDVDVSRRTVRVRLDSRRDSAGVLIASLPCDYLDAGHLAQAYAITGHKAQGMTARRAFILGDEHLYREWGYTSLSRGREENRLYVVAGESEQADDPNHGRSTAPAASATIWDLTEALRESRAQRLALDQLAHLAAPVQARPPRSLRELAEGLDDTRLRAEIRASRAVVDEPRPRSAVRTVDRETEVARLAGDRQRIESWRARLADDVDRWQADLDRTSGFLSRRRHHQQRTWREADIRRSSGELDRIDTELLPRIGAALDALHADAVAEHEWNRRRADAREWAATLESEVCARAQRRVRAAEAELPCVDVPAPTDLAAREAWRAHAHAAEMARLLGGGGRRTSAAAIHPDAPRAVDPLARRARTIPDVAATLDRITEAEGQERERIRASRERMAQRHREHETHARPARDVHHDRHRDRHRDGPCMSP